MPLYFDKDMQFKPEDLLTFKEALEGFEALHDYELIELIKTKGVKIWDKSRAVKDENKEPEEYYIYCREVNIENLDYPREFIPTLILKKDLEVLAKEDPRLNWKKLESSDSLKAESIMKSLRQELDQLQMMLKVKEQELVECRKLIPTAVLDGKAQKTAERWAGHVETAVRLALYCMENHTTYTEEQLNNLCQKNFGEKLPREALAAFKKGMPEGIIKGRGAPPRK